MNLPCKDCLIIPVCRHKSYNKMVSDCDNVYEYLAPSPSEVGGREDNINHTRRIENVECILTPTRWSLTNRLLKEHT